MSNNFWQSERFPFGKMHDPVADTPDAAATPVSLLKGILAVLLRIEQMLKSREQ